MLTLQEVENALGFSQPELKIIQAGDVIRAEGNYIVADGPNDTGALTRYEITGLFPCSFPSAEPIIIEEGRRIKRDADYHMYTNGTCCVCIWEEWLAISVDISFQAFCDGPLHNFFLSQYIFEKTGKWPFGERSHGVFGLLEAISSILSMTITTTQATQYLKILSKRRIKGHWACPCGSGNRIQSCHAMQIETLRSKISEEKANLLRKRLLSILRADNKD